MKRAILTLCCAALLTGCSSTGGAPAHFKARFDTSKGAFVVEVKREWAPLGADRFYELVKSGFYDESRFFRIAPGFVVQWGINKDPQVTAQWRDKKLSDDPVKERNIPGWVSFASSGPNTRTTQLFINLAYNDHLDQMGFAAFGRVTEGINVVASFYGAYQERPQQSRIETEGNAYLQREYPNLDFVKTARIE